MSFETNAEPELTPYRVVGAMIATIRLHRKSTARFVQTMGLHPTQHRVLMYLSQLETPCNQRELSVQFELTPAAVAQTVDKLETLGYVTRVPSETDNRCKRVVLTERGRETAEQSRRAFELLDAKLVGTLTDEELTHFYRVLLQMQKNMESDASDAKGEQE